MKSKIKTGKTKEKLCLNLHVDKSGFTLIEIAIVIFIMLLMTSATVPWMRTFAESNRLRSSARSIRSLMEFARTSSVTQRTEYVVLFDIENQEYWLSLLELLEAGSDGTVVGDMSRTSLTDSLDALAQSNEVPLANDDEGLGETTFSRTGGVLGIPKQPSGGIEISRIISSRSSDREGGYNYIVFRPDGTAEDFEIYLSSSSGRVYMVSVTRTTGRTNIKELIDEEKEELGLLDEEE
ncbi:prepilin-type N-terminal cleavage/methylation domain-containing protein [Candidatus Poribacteria bacterium]|nr:prepilin-type N-terminal cleavage/methylation domain-containing protein [Candidatus Poribacteria bacterium]